jgi:putative nucleotidyltransferase with HDIG domain
MLKEQTTDKSQAYQTVVITTGVALWLVSAWSIFRSFDLAGHLIIMALVPLVVMVGMFPNTFPALGLKFTLRKITLSFSDAIVLLVACLYGLTPAVFLAGIEGYTGSRRVVRRLSSNLFSSGMMSLAAAASSFSLNAVLYYGWGQEAGTGRSHDYLSAVVALLVAGFVQITVNMGLLSPLLALREGNPILRSWKESFLWAAPMFIPVGAAASLMYIALQYDLLIMLIISGPIFLAIYLGQRQYRNSVQERINLMDKAHRETIEALAVTINAKDEVTHEHVLRVQVYAAGVARILGCSYQEIEALKAGALLHDIGKIAVPDYILNKPGKLTAAEFEKMKLHTIAGAQILGRVEFPYPVVPVVRHHHERWDGCGYPDGLKGEEIPVTARILSVVDCFDAVREDRQYRKGMTRDEAIDLIMKGSGSQYDAKVVATFIAHLPEFEKEIEMMRDMPAPTFGIEPTEQLSEAARNVTPAAGLAEVDRKDKYVTGALVDRNLKAVSELAQAIISARSQGEIVIALTDRIQSVVPFDLCAVTLVVPELGDNIVVHAVGRDAHLLRGRNIETGEGVTGWVIANHQPFCNADPKLDLPPSLCEKFSEYRTMAAFPIIKDQDMHGAVAFYSASTLEYTPTHQIVIEQAVSLIATALSIELRKISSDAQAHGSSSQVRPIRQTPSGRLKMVSAMLDSEMAH